MEEEERQKKVEVGREKFAAYQKKKNAVHHGKQKEKKKKGDNEDDGSPTSSTASTCSLATSENLDRSKSRNDELDGIPLEKDIATHTLLQELEELRSSTLPVVSSIGLSESDVKDHLQKYRSRVEDFQAALEERDKIIEQLTNSLQQAISSRDLYQSEGERLTQDLSALKIQLQATRDLVQSQQWETGIKPEDYLALTEKVLAHEAVISKQENKISELINITRLKDEELSRKTTELKEHKTKSSEEVQKLMRDVEIMQQKAVTIEYSHRDQLSKLRSELEENFGFQLTQIKEELRNQHENEKFVLIHKYEELKNELDQERLRASHMGNLAQTKDVQITELAEKVVSVEEQNRVLETKHDRLLANANELISDEISKVIYKSPEYKAEKQILECTGEFECTHKTKLESYEKKIESLNERLQEAIAAEENFPKVLTAHKENYEEELAMYRQKLDELDVKLQAALQSEKKYLEVISDKEVKLLSLKEQLEDMSRNEIGMKETNDALKLEISNLNSKLIEYSKYKEEAEKQKQEVQILNEKITNMLLPEAVKAKDEITSLKKELEEMSHFKSEAAELHERITSLNKKLEDVAEENVSYKTQLQILNERLSQSTEAEKEHSQQISYWEGEISKYKVQLDVLVDSINTIEEKHSTELNKMSASYEQQLSLLNDEFNKKLESFKLAHDNEISSYKSQLELIKKEREANLNIAKKARDYEVRESDLTASRKEQETHEGVSQELKSTGLNAENEKSIQVLNTENESRDSPHDDSHELILCKQQVKTLTERLEESCKNDKLHAEEILECQAELERYKQQVDYLEDRYSTELAASTEEADELRNEVQRLSTELSARKNEVDELGTKVRELLSIKESYETQFPALTDHVENLTAELKEKNDREVSLLLEVESYKNKLQYMSSAWHYSKSGPVDYRSMQDHMLATQEQVEALNVQLQESVVSKERYIAKVDDLNKVVENYREQLRNSELTEKAMQEEIQTYKLQLNCLVMEKIDLQNHLTEMRRCEESIRAEANQMQNKLMNYQRHFEEEILEINMIHDREINELSCELHHLHEKLTEKSQDVVALQKTIENMSAEKSSPSTNETELMDILNNLTAEKLKLEALLAGQDEIEQHWMSEAETYKTQSEELSRNITTLNEKLLAKDESNKVLTQRVLDLETLHRQLIEENDELSSKVTKAKDLLRRVKDEVEEKTNMISELEIENRSLKKENLRLQGQETISGEQENQSGSLGHDNKVNGTEYLSNEAFKKDSGKFIILENKQSCNAENGNITEELILIECEKDKELIILKENHKILKNAHELLQKKLDVLQATNQKLLEDLEQAWKSCEVQKQKLFSAEKQLKEQTSETRTSEFQKSYLEDPVINMDFPMMPNEVEELRIDIDRLQSDLSEENRFRFESTLDIHQKMELLLKSNTELVSERESLLEKLKKQQELLVQLKSPDMENDVLNTLTTDCAEVITNLTSQHQKHVSLVDSANVLQEVLRSQKEELLAKLEEKQEVDEKLMKEQKILNDMQLKLQSLEHQLLQKDIIHQELARQKHMLEENLKQIEARLKAQEESLEAEKLKFEAEIRSRELSIRSWKLKAEVEKMDKIQPSSTIEQQNIQALREELNAVHNRAVARLKTHLTEQFQLNLSKVKKTQEEQLKSLREQLKCDLEKLQQMIVTSYIQPPLAAAHKPQVNGVETAAILNSSDEVTSTENLQPVILNQIVKMKDEFEASVESQLSCVNDVIDNMRTTANDKQEEVVSVTDKYEDRLRYFGEVEQELCDEYTRSLKGLVDWWRTVCRKRLSSTLEQLEEALQKEETARNESDLDAAMQHQENIASLLSSQEQLFADLQDFQNSVEQFHTHSVQELHANLEAGHQKVLEQLKSSGTSPATNKEDGTTQTSMFSQVVNNLEQEMQAKHEKEMAELRQYFEQKCADLEKRYSEEVFSHHSHHISASSEDSAEELVPDYYGNGDNLTVQPITHIGESLESRDEEDIHADCKKSLLDSRNRLQELQRILDEKYRMELEAVKKEYDHIVEVQAQNAAKEIEKHKKELEETRIVMEALVGKHIEEKENANDSSEKNGEKSVTKEKDVDDEEFASLQRLIYEEARTELGHDVDEAGGSGDAKLEPKKGLDFWQLFDKLKAHITSVGVLDSTFLGLLSDLGIAHSLSIKVAVTEAEEKEQKLSEEHESALQQVRLSCERRLQEQVEEARCDIVTMLRDHLQTLLTNSSDSAPKSQELIVLEEKLLAPHKEEVAQLKKELAAVKLQLAKEDSSSQLAVITKERDDLLNLTNVLRHILKELVEYFTHCEDELNTSFEETCLSEDTSSNMSENRRVHFAPDVSCIANFLEDDSVFECTTGEVQEFSSDFRNELERCLKRLKNEATAVWSLSKKLIRQREEIVTEGYGEQVQHKRDVRSLEDMTQLKEKAKAMFGDQESPYLKLIEDICHEGDRLSEEARRERDDLRLQVSVELPPPQPSSSDSSGAKHEEVEAADKQLKSTRQFLEEQAAEREQERDDFLREIADLEEKLKERDKEKLEHLQRIKEVENLEQQLKEQAVLLSISEEKRERLHAELENAAEKISTLREIIVELESSLESKNHLEKQVTNLHSLLDEQCESHRQLSEELETARAGAKTKEIADHIEYLEDQLRRHRRQVEQNPTDGSVLKQMKTQIREIESTLERKTKELESLHVGTSNISVSSPSEDVSIREHLETLRSDTPSPIALPVDDIHRLQDKLVRHSRAEEAAMKRVRDLEMQLRTSKRNEEEITAERDILQDRVEEQLLKISSLQARLDEQRRAVNSIHAEVITELENEIRDRKEEGVQLRQALDEKNKEIKQLETLLERTRQQMIRLEHELEIREDVVNKDQSSQTSLFGSAVTPQTIVDILISDLKTQVEDLKYYRALPLTTEQLRLMEIMRAGRGLDSFVPEEPDELRDANHDTELHRSYSIQFCRDRVTPNDQTDKASEIVSPVRHEDITENSNKETVSIVGSSPLHEVIKNDVPVPGNEEKVQVNFDQLVLELRQQLEEKVTEVQQLKDQIASMPSQSYVESLHEEKNAEIANMNKKLQNMKEENQGMMSKLKVKQGELDHMQEYVRQMSDDYRRTLAIYEDMKKHEETVKKEQEVVSRKLKSCEQENVKLNGLLVSLQLEKEQLESACSALQQEKDELQAEHFRLLDELNNRPASLDELSHQVQRELEESAQLDMSLLEKLGETDDKDDTADPTLKSILKKALKDGFNALTLSELTVLHQHTISASSTNIFKDTPHSDLQVKNSLCDPSTSSHEENWRLVSLNKELQDRLKQQEDESNIKLHDLEKSIDREKSKVSELRQTVTKERELNDKLRAYMSAQVDAIHDLEVQREIIYRRSTHAEEDLQSLKSKFVKATRRIQELETILVNEKEKVKSLEQLLDEKKKREVSVSISECSSLESSQRQQEQIVVPKDVNTHFENCRQSPSSESSGLSQQAQLANTQELEAEKKKLQEMVTEIMQKLSVEREVVQCLLTEVCQVQERRDHYKAEAEKYLEEIETIKKNSCPLKEFEALKAQYRKIQNHLEELKNQNMGLQIELQLAKNNQLKSEERLKNVKEELEIQQKKQNEVLHEVAAIVEAGNAHPIDLDNDSHTTVLGRVRNHRAELQQLLAKSNDVTTTTLDVEQVKNEVEKLEQKLFSSRSEESGHTESNSSLIFRLKCVNNKLEEHFKDCEINDLTILRLNEECRNLQKKVEELQDRNKGMVAAWEQEKVVLKAALEQAQVQHSVPATTVIDLENKLKQVFAKYLRIESYRKALIWQKRYLIIVLDGYRQYYSCGSNRTDTIAGAWYRDVPRTHNQKFRAAVFAVIAVSRMRFVLNRWRYGNRLRKYVSLTNLATGLSPTNHLEPVTGQLESNNHTPSRYPHRGLTSLRNMTNPEFVAVLSSSQLAEYVDRFDQIQQNLGLSGTSQRT